MKLRPRVLIFLVHKWNMPMILQLPTSISFLECYVVGCCVYFVFVSCVHLRVVLCYNSRNRYNVFEKTRDYMILLHYVLVFFLLNVFWMFERFSGWRGMLSYIIPADRPECIASYYSCITQREAKKEVKYLGKLSNNSNFPHLLFRWLAKFIYIFCFGYHIK